MKKVISCLLLVTLCLASLLAIIPTSAAEVTKVNLMYGGLDTAATDLTLKPGAEAQFAGNGNVYYFDYHKYVALDGKFPMPDSAKGTTDWMIRFDHNDGSGTASVCDGVKGSGVFLHKVGSSYTVGEGDTAIEYTQMFGYAFKESVIADKIKLWLPKTATTGEGDYTCTISEIDVYGATVDKANKVFAREAEKTLLASFKNVKDQTPQNVQDPGSLLPSSAIVLEAELNEALQIDYLLFGVKTEAKYKFYEIELDGIMATQKDAAITDFNNNPLKQQYARIKGALEEEYTEVTWTVLEAALAQTDPVNKNCLATLTELQAAAEILKPAIDQLKAKPANKTELIASINAVASLVEADYTPKSWANLQAALTTATTMRDAEEYAYTQKQVNEAKKALDDAKAALVTKPNKNDLAAEIAKLANYKEADYTPKTWSELKTAVEKANSVNSDVNAAQAEVDEAKAALAAAYAALAKPGNKEALKAEVEKAKALKQDDFATVTALAWELLQMEIGDAEAVIADINATQSEVDAALEALKGQINNLIPKDKENGDGSGNGDGEGSGTTNATTDADADADADAAESTPQTEAPKSGGCGSSIALSALAIVGVVGAGIALKKKEN